MSRKTTVTYRTYLSPGILFDEEETAEVTSRDVKAATREAPKGAFAFQFFERTNTRIDGETLWGQEKNPSPVYYLGGDVYTLPEVEKKFPAETILISNMRGNGYARVIQTRRGNWKPLKKKDVLVPV